MHFLSGVDRVPVRCLFTHRFLLQTVRHRHPLSIKVPPPHQTMQIPMLLSGSMNKN
jgi:hypothetical protein